MEKGETVLIMEEKRKKMKRDTSGRRGYRVQYGKERPYF